MAGKKSPSYNSPKRILSKEEYDKYVAQQQEPRRAELQEKIKAGEKNIQRFRAQQKYNNSTTGRVGSFFTRAAQMARPGGVTQALYQRAVPITSKNVQQEYPTAPRTVRGSSGGKVGRPRQTYDKRYAAYGGVYGFRKWQAAQFRAQRIELQRRNTITPQQQMAINQVQAQQAYNQQNVENRIIPDTYGQVPLNNIFREVDIASNLFA